MKIDAKISPKINEKTNKPTTILKQKKRENLIVEKNSNPTTKEINLMKISDKIRQQERKNKEFNTIADPSAHTINQILLNFND